VKGSGEVEEIKPIFELPFFGHSLGVTEGLIIQWVIIIAALVISMILTKNLKRIPDKRQSALELVIGGINNIVKSIMGKDYLSLAPYVGSLIIFLTMMNLTGLIGFEAPTKDYSVTLGMGLTTFIVIQATVIKRSGVGHYFGAYAKPFAFLTPINVLDRVILPISLSLRLFGNMTAGAVVVGLAYKALGSIPIFNVVPGTSWIGQLLLPIPIHVYFDLFDGCVQVLIFTMLTMINIKVTSEE
jgi:F-type H+-transporting ATPase subunit a